MHVQNLNGISNKINELKALFIFGQRVLPFLEELFQFVQEVIPLLDEINASIKESTSKMPRASSQLNKVTQATELATTEILDTIDSILFKLGTVKSGRQKELDLINRAMRLDTRMIRILRKELGHSHPELLGQINAMHKEKRALLKASLQEDSRLADVLNEIHDKTSNILMSLQVQDITAQQIAAVNHLIESIEEHLEKLICRFKNGQNVFAEDDVAGKHKAFNPDAIYDTSGAQQQAADEIFQNPAPAAEPADQADQGEINKLFRETSSEATAAEEGTSTPPGEDLADLHREASQEEIDKLFGN